MGTTREDLERAGFEFKYWPTGHPTRWRYQIEGHNDDGVPIVVEVDDDDVSKAEERAWALAIEKYDASSRETVRERNRKRKERDVNKGLKE